MAGDHSTGYTGVEFASQSPYTYFAAATQIVTLFRQDNDRNFRPESSEST